MKAPYLLSTFFFILGSTQFSLGGFFFNVTPTTFSENQANSIATADLFVAASGSDTIFAAGPIALQMNLTGGPSNFFFLCYRFETHRNRFLPSSANVGPSSLS